MKGKDREILKRYEKDMKGYAIAGLVLASISAFILLVDKYLAGTLFWWIVIILSCVGYIYMRIDRDLHWHPLRKKPRILQYSGPDASLTDPESKRSFSLHDVVKIEIETTGDGPFDEDFYWIFHLQSAPPVRMAGPVGQMQGIFDILNQFDGADFEKTIQASATVEPAQFLIWEKYRDA